MIDERAKLIESAAECLGQNTKPILARLVECDGGDWYLREKIVKAPDRERVRDNSRVLKYAAHFEANGGKITFVRERSGRTPDLEVGVAECKFYMEVRHFRMSEEDASSGQASRIVDVVTKKKRQLPPSQIGFVAIENSDLRLESSDEDDLTHDHIVEGLCEIQRLATSNPDGWRQPSGVIVAAMSTWETAVSEPPHFVWINRDGECRPPAQLVEWLLSSLPSSRLSKAPNECSAGGEAGMPPRPPTFTPDSSLRSERQKQFRGEVT